MLKTYAAVLALTVCVSASAQHESDQTIVVQASSFSDPAMTVGDDVECALFLQYLQEDEHYKLIATAGVQGPPGVVYTLESPKHEVAIVKCGRGGGCGGEASTP